MIAAQVLFWYCLALMAFAVLQPVLRERWNIHLHPPDRFALALFTWGRHAVSVIPWDRGFGWTWAERGYDGLYHTWALYPLIEYEPIPAWLYEELSE